MGKKYGEDKAEVVAPITAPPPIESASPAPAIPTFDLTTFAGRAAAVSYYKLGLLEEHVCCPSCGFQYPPLENEKAICHACNWTGDFVQLVDTVVSGATKLPA